MLYLQEPSCVALDQKDGVALCAAQAQQHSHPWAAPPGTGGSLAQQTGKQCCGLWTPDAAAHKSLLTGPHVAQPSFPPSVLVLLLILLYTWAFGIPTAPGRCRWQEAGSSYMCPPLLFRAPSKHLTGFILM